MPKLCQIIAIVKTRKANVEKAVTALHHASSKEAMLQGITRVYTPKDENGEKQPSENKKVQIKAMDAFKDAAKQWTSMFDVVATQDAANCQAKADVVVDGVTILKAVPATHLLFLAKQLVDVHTFVDKLPTLDPAQPWDYDQNAGCFRTSDTEQLKTAKVQEPLVLYPATKEHPAQTQLVTKDVTVGTWKTTYFSGAIPADQKQKLLARIVKLQEAVQFAREQANQLDVENVETGKPIFDFILAD